MKKWILQAGCHAFRPRYSAFGIMGIMAYLVVFRTMRALKSTLSRSFCVIYVLTAVIVSFAMFRVVFSEPLFDLLRILQEKFFLR